MLLAPEERLRATAAVAEGHVEVLRWARENCCPWDAPTRDRPAEKFGYADDLGSLFNNYGNPI